MAELTGIPNSNLRLNQFQVGQTWLMGDAVRVVRIESQGEVEILDTRQSPPVMETKKAFVGKATIVTLPIPGFISRPRANQGKLIRKALIQPKMGGLDKPDDDDVLDDEHISDGTWTEVYAERLVHPTKRERGFVEVDETKFEQQVYCQEVSGEGSERAATGILKMPVHGVLIPAEVVPKGLFPDEIVAEANKEAPAPLDGLSYQQLQQLAKEKGINSHGKKKPELIEALSA